MKRGNLLIAVIVGAVSAICVYYDISLFPLVLVLGILTLTLFLHHILLITLNNWLNRRRTAAYPEWEDIRAGLEDIRAGRVREITTVRDLLESEENNHDRDL